MKLRIGIDGRSLEKNITGVGRYVWELCLQLEKHIPDAEFFVYSQWPLSVAPISARWHHRVDDFSAKKYMKSIVWQKLRAGAMCRKDRLDVYWAGATFSPRLPKSVRMVVSVHDLNHEIAPETMPTATLWAHRLFFKHDILAADAITSNSIGTADRLVASLGRRSDAVVTPAVSPAFVWRADRSATDVLDKLGVSKPYMLALATWEPRKNLASLISAFLSLKNEGAIPEHQLVLAGGRGWKDSNLSAMVDQTASNNVVALGYVDDADLPALYSAADSFVFPSFYEGFGIPLLEARANNTQVICTDIPELRESGGKNAIFIQPDVAGIRAGILEAYAHQDRNEQAMLDDSDLPTWQDEARKLAELIAVREVN
jgi:glycosyltransferase involved in cell wall biosynthesis